MTKRRLKWLGKFLGSLILLLAVFLLLERWRGQIGLAQFKQELRTQGESILPEDFHTSCSPAENGAATAIAAVQSLTNGTCLPDNLAPRMHILASGRALVGARESEWYVKDPYRDEQFLKGIFTNHWQELEADLTANATALAALRQALQQPVLNNDLNLAAGSKLRFDHLLPAKRATYWLGGASQLALHRGRPTEATPFLRAQITLPRWLGADQIAISELVRIAISAIARTDTWEALQVNGWTDDNLATLQQAWLTQSFITNMCRALAGERVYIASSYQEMRQSNDYTYELLFGTWSEFWDDSSEEAGGWTKWLEALPYGEAVRDAVRRQIYCRLWRFAWSHQAELRTWENLGELIRLAHAAAARNSFPALESELEALLVRLGSKSCYERLRFPPPDSVSALSKTIEKAARAETDRSLTLAAIALKRYELKHGHYPAQLGELTPDFLAIIPTDFMDGKPIKYRRDAEHQFTLYSVGADGRDDGGDLTPTTKSGSRNLWLRRDYVWPQPATPEEVAEYRRDASGANSGAGAE